MSLSACLLLFYPSNVFLVGFGPACSIALLSTPLYPYRFTSHGHTIEASPCASSLLLGHSHLFTDIFVGDMVVPHCIIEHLASPSKEKLKVAYGTLSPWLQSLATFTGCAFKKYNIELTGLLQYVANQLKAGKSFDLCVLREIVENMSGIETAQGQLTLDQVESLCGGEILKQEGAYFNQIKNTKRSINRLKEALLQEDLVVGLCLLMSQQRYCIVYKEGVDMHLKLVGQMLDQCQQTLVQFASFLSSNLKNDDYARCMPSAIELIKDYHISPDAAMFLTRPVYTAKINVIYDELKRMDRINKQLNAEKKIQHYQKACSDVLGTLAKDLSTAYPSKVWDDLRCKRPWEPSCYNMHILVPKLFTTFWTLTAYDIYVPGQAYERELEKLRRQISQLDDVREAAELKKKKDREQKLCDEQRRQIDHTNRVMQRLSAEKNEWFSAKGDEHTGT
uniref:THO complex subunitTHOC2 C-terminal domain-containing protein n=1 Tax=Romanomermis culicivorax TaxID=13658 RepID=A0A915HG33_ROMCU